MNRHSLFTSSSKTAKAAGSACRFFGRLFCLFLILSICFVKIIMPQYLYSYNASLLDKTARLESITEPKIVLIGNSNLSFGIQSELLEEAFGMPVVNMGLHGGLGNAFHEEMIPVNLQEGDIIILAHTSFQEDDTLTDPVLGWLTVENHSRLWSFLRLKDIPDMYLSFPDYAKRALTLWAEKSGNTPDYGTPYSRVAFNEYGDVSFPRPESTLDSSYFEETPIYIPGIDESSIKRLNHWNSYITERKATMLIAAYPIPQTKNTPAAAEYIQFQKELEERLDCAVISDYTDYIIDSSYFYDTNSHLTDDGARLRTELLISDLRHWMASRSSSGKTDNTPSS